MHEPLWSLGHKVTFDGPNKLIRVNNGVTALNVQRDIYSAWKEWWIYLSDNPKWEAAMRSTGGDPLPGILDLGATFFLTNGWRIKPWKGFYTLTITGNIYTEEGESPTVDPDFPSGATIIYTVSNLVDQIEDQSSVIAEAVVNADISSASDLALGGAIREIQKVGYATKGNVIAGSTVSAIKTDIVNTDGYYDGMAVHIIDGGDMITRNVDGYLNTSGTFILTNDAPFAPNAGATIYVLTRHSARSGRV